jgi:hypothetical protein
MGCYARFSSNLRAGADAKVAARGQAGAGRHEFAGAALGYAATVTVVATS